MSRANHIKGGGMCLVYVTGMSRSFNWGSTGLGRVTFDRVGDNKGKDDIEGDISSTTR